MTKPIAAGPVTMQRHGRHHYHVLASPEVARMQEKISQFAATRNIAQAGRTVRPGPRDAALRIARSWYDHLVGRLSVAITDAMIGRGQIELDCDCDCGGVSGDGEAFL